MQTRNPFIDDLTKMASGAVGALTGVKDEVEARVRDQIAKILDGMDIPRRDEFEAVKAMAAKAREENEELKKQIAELQAQDHAGMNVRPMLIGVEGRTCLLVFSVKLKGDDVAYWDLLHVGDRALFSAHAQELADTILPESEKAVLAADLRFVEPSSREGERETFAVPRFYKTTRLRPEEIDNLYSEVQLMDLKLD